MKKIFVKQLYLFLLILLVSFMSVNAEIIANSHGVPLPHELSRTYSGGVSIIPYQDMNLTIVTITPLATPTNCSLYYGGVGSSNLLSWGAIVDHNASFNYKINESKQYYILCGKNGASYTVYYEGSLTMPYGSSNLDFVNGSTSDNLGDNKFFNIITVVTNNGTLPAPFVRTITINSTTNLYYNADDLDFSCIIDDTDTADINYHFAIYKNSVLYRLYNESNIPQDTSRTVKPNINYTISNVGDNFTLSCWGDDNILTGETLNKTITIIDNTPVLTNLNTITGLTNLTINLTTMYPTNLTVTINGTTWNTTSYLQTTSITIFNLSPRNVYYFNMSMCNIIGYCLKNTSSRQTKTTITTKAYEIISNDLIENSNATLEISYTGGESESITQTVTNGIISFIVGSNNYYTKHYLYGNITVYAPNYINHKTINFSGIGSLINHYYNTNNFYSGVLNITAYDDDDEALTTFNITLRSLNYSYILTQNTSNNWTSFNLINGTYNLSIEGVGYADRYINYLVGSAIYYNYSFTVQQGGWANIIFYDELTKSLITTRNISFEAISDTFANNYSTSTSTLGINLTQGDYIFRYSTIDYNEKFYYTTILEDMNYTFNLYLLQNTSSDKLTVTLYDQNNNVIEGYTIKLLKYYLDTNSYTLVDMKKTNAEGKAELLVELYTEFYKLMVENPSGDLLLTTEPAYVYDNTMNLQIIIGTVTGEHYFTTEGVNWEINFNEVTNKFILTYADPTNTLDLMSLRVYRIIALNGSNLFNQTSSTSPSGSISVWVSNTTGATYEAKAYVSFSPATFLGSRIHTFYEANPFGNMGVFITFILVMVMAFIGFWSLPVAVILVPLAVAVSAGVGFIQINLGLAFSLVVLGIIVAVMIKGRKNG